jgi:hypothetical protein
MKLNGIVGAYVMMGMGIMETVNAQCEKRKKEILAEWDNSKNYPRKKKKRVRKELQLNWNIACWNPLEN